MEEVQKKSSLNPRLKYRATRPYSQTRTNTSWQGEDHKVLQLTPPYKCLCGICYKQQLRIPQTSGSKLPNKVCVEKTKFLYSCLVSKGQGKAMSILIVDSCFYHQGKPQRIFYSEKGVIVESKSKEITEQYVFHRLVEETKIENAEDSSSLLSRNNRAETKVAYVNARECNILIPKWSQFNESHKSIFNVKVYRKGDAPDFSSKKSNDQTYSTIIHYKDRTMVLLSANNFDKMMKDRRQGNPHVTFIQSYVKPKFVSKKNYYGILITTYNTKERYNIKQGLYESARANIMKYLDKDPFAVDDLNEDSLSTEDLAIFYMYRIVEYLKENQDIIVNSITLAWTYSVNNQLFLSYCSELDYVFGQKIAMWTHQSAHTRNKSQSKILSEAISDQSALLYQKWQSIKARYKQKSIQKVEQQRKMYTDKSQTIFQMMYPEGDFNTLRSDTTKTARLNRTATSFKKSTLGSSLKMRSELKKDRPYQQKWSRTKILYNTYL